MPDDFEKSLGRLQNYLTDDQICVILSSNNSLSANKIMLDYLIARINNESELLDFCDQLQAITSEQDMTDLINLMRQGKSATNKNY